MAAYRDLEPCGYFGEAWATKLVAVGWIESRDQLTRGPVDEGFFEALVALLVDPWQPFAQAGAHRCTLCRFTGGPAVLRFRDREVALGATNVFVLAEDQAYVAPSLIAHYVDAHEYAPPEAFQKAVLGSPRMKSMDYLKLLRRQGIDQLAKHRG